jgi:hydroxyacylglutathione hydrolase
LFVGGCGRFFEGTGEDMIKTFRKFKKLDKCTEVYCGHEYTIDNLKFALSVDPHNKDLISKYKWGMGVFFWFLFFKLVYHVYKTKQPWKVFNILIVILLIILSLFNLSFFLKKKAIDRVNQGLPTVPSTIGDEMLYNPFMRCNDIVIRKAVGEKTKKLTEAQVADRLREMKNNFKTV